MLTINQLNNRKVPWCRKASGDFFYHYSLLKVIGAADCSGTVAKVLTGNIMESAFQGKVLADILVDSYFRIEIGRGIGRSGGMTVSTPDEIGSKAPAVWQSKLRSQLEDGKIVIAGIS